MGVDAMFVRRILPAVAAAAALALTAIVPVASLIALGDRGFD